MVASYLKLAWVDLQSLPARTKYFNATQTDEVTVTVVFCKLQAKI